MAKVMSKQRRNRFVTPCCIALGCVLSLSIAAGAVATSFTASAGTGDEATVTEVARRYTSDYGSKDEVVEAALDLNVRVAEEGMVLMENNGILPLETSMGKKTKVSVFGTNALSPSTGGADGVYDASAGVVKDENDVFGVLEDAGYAVNPTVKKFYEDAKDSGLSSDSAIADAYTNGIIDALNEMGSSLKTYSDAAIIVIGDGSSASASAGGPPSGDAGGAGGPGPMSAGVETYDDSIDIDASDADAVSPGSMSFYKYDDDGNIIGTSLTYGEEEIDLIESVATYFDDVIVVLNTATPVEMGEIDDLYQEGTISAIVQCSEPGNDGLIALGSLLKGDVSFSGHTTDIWARYFDRSPSFMNYGAAYYIDADGNATDSTFDEYEEGIYMGYRYYETVAAEKNGVSSGSGETWYNSEVVYPFGYGLSYTDFTYEIVSDTSLSADSSVNVDKDIIVKVKVTNTGDYAGKAVAQLYYSAPYAAAEGIEKSYVVLGDYVKTDTLNPGQSQTVSVKISPREMASYSSSANSGKGEYVLSAGGYSLMIMEDSHNAACDGNGDAQAVTWNLSNAVEITTSEATGAEIVNQFDDLTEHMERDDNNIVNLSRSMFSDDSFDITDTLTPQAHRAVRVFVEGVVTGWEDIFDKEAYLKGETSAFDFTDPEVYDATFLERDFDENPDNEVDPWYTDVMPTTGADNGVILSDLIGLDYDDPLWDELLDQLTVEDMAQLIDWGAFYSDEIDYIEKPFVRDTDGPSGWTGTGTSGSDYPCFAAEPMIAATFNTELVYELGIMLGEEGLWGNSDDSEDVMSYTGWYSPGMNIHRSYFDSRYEEYYSEDAYLTGTMAACMSNGAAEKGVYVYLKHFALFGDMSGLIMSNTGGVCNWLTEQTLREIYLKGFEIGVEEGNAQGIMVSFARFGTTWSGASYNLLTNVVKGEWGFHGIIITDIVLFDFEDAMLLVRAGGNLMLRNAENGIFLDTTNPSASQVACMREACHGILYVTANSNAMQPVYGAAVNITASDVSESATLGASYSGSVTAEENTYSKYGEVSYAVTNGALPDGLTLDASTGKISGTPTKAGTYVFEITASATFYESDSIWCTITVSDASSGSTGDTGSATTTGVISVTQSGTQLVIEYADGTTSYIEMNVTVDEEGNVVVGVASMEIIDGDLYVYYTDGTSENLGTVVGADGKDGEDGSGCGSAVELAGAAIVMAIVLAAAAAVYVISRKRRNSSEK